MPALMLIIAFLKNKYVQLVIILLVIFGMLIGVKSIIEEREYQKIKTHELQEQQATLHIINVHDAASLKVYDDVNEQITQDTTLHMNDIHAIERQVQVKPNTCSYQQPIPQAIVDKLNEDLNSKTLGAN